MKVMHTIIMNLFLENIMVVIEHKIKLAIIQQPLQCLGTASLN